MNTGAAAGVADVLERVRRSVPAPPISNFERASNGHDSSSIAEYKAKDRVSFDVAESAFERATHEGLGKTLVKLLEDAYRKASKIETGNRNSSSASQNTGVEAAFAEAIRGLSHLAFCAQTHDNLLNGANSKLAPHDTRTHLYRFPISAKGHERDSSTEHIYPPRWGQTTQACRSSVSAAILESPCALRALIKYAKSATSSTRCIQSLNLVHFTLSSKLKEKSKRKLPMTISEADYIVKELLDIVDMYMRGTESAISFTMQSICAIHCISQMLTFVKEILRGSSESAEYPRPESSSSTNYPLSKDFLNISSNIIETCLSKLFRLFRLSADSNDRKACSAIAACIAEEISLVEIVSSNNSVGDDSAGALNRSLSPRIIQRIPISSLNFSIKSEIIPIENVGGDSKFLYLSFLDDCQSGGAWGPPSSSIFDSGALLLCRLLWKGKDCVSLHEALLSNNIADRKNMSKNNLDQSHQRVTKSFVHGSECDVTISAWLADAGVTASIVNILARPPINTNAGNDDLSEYRANMNDDLLSCMSPGAILNVLWSLYAIVQGSSLGFSTGLSFDMVSALINLLDTRHILALRRWQSSTNSSPQADMSESLIAIIILILQYPFNQSTIPAVSSSTLNSIHEAFVRHNAISRLVSCMAACGPRIRDDTKGISDEHNFSIELLTGMTCRLVLGASSFGTQFLESGGLRRSTTDILFNPRNKVSFSLCV